MTSINTNIYAMQALFGLDRANQQLGVAQKRVNTGYRVNDANDDGATFAIAQSVRGNINAYDAVIDQLRRAKGTMQEHIAMASSTLETVEKEIKPLMVKLADNSLTGDARAQIKQDLIQAVNLAISKLEQPSNQKIYDENAGLAPVNLFDVLDISNVTVISGISGQNIRLQAIEDTGNANTLKQIFNDNISFLIGYNKASEFINELSNPGSTFNQIGVKMLADSISLMAGISRRIDNAIKFNTTLRDAAEIGLGAMVDADLGRESAKLQSAQIKQQMAIQSLGIANNSNRNVLALFGRFA